MAQKLVQKFPFETIIEEGPKIKTRRKWDALKFLIQKQWILPYRDGQWVYGEEMCKLFSAIINLWRHEFAKKMGFKERIFPRLVDYNTVKNFGIFTHGPEFLFTVNPCKKIKGNFHDELYLDMVQSGTLYSMLAKKPLNKTDLPIKIFEVLGGFLWRNETKNDLDGIIRTREFHKLELVYFGTPEQVRKARKNLIKAYKKIFNLAKIRWRIVVGPPLCKDTQDLFYKAQILEDVPLYDFQFYIPQHDKWVEIGGVCFEGDSNVKTYKIRCKDNTELWSGCSGFGLNRIAFAILSQHGPNFSKYPPIIKKYL